MIRSYRDHFSAALSGEPERIHIAAHSHHPWPDVTSRAQHAAWQLAATELDNKWATILETVVPEAQGHVTRRLGLPDPTSVAFAPNTHEFLVRIVSCLPQPVRILTTDAEFHSAERQFRRWEEAGAAVVERVPAEPFDTFTDRFAAAMRADHHLVWLSHVFFNSGYVVEDLPALINAVPADDTVVAIDGYHGFMAVPTDLSAVAQRAFYTAGGYKYAMSGEGVCFLHAPPGYGTRPIDTGWYATFGNLSQAQSGQVAYASDGWRFAGATFDPSGLFRFNAVQRWLDELGVGVANIHAHVRALQQRFVDGLKGRGISLGELLPGHDAADRGHFLTFRSPHAGWWQQQLTDAGVVTDHRADRLRFGFGIYHDTPTIDEVISRITAIATEGSSL